MFASQSWHFYLRDEYVEEEKRGESSRLTFVCKFSLCWKEILYIYTTINIYSFLSLFTFIFHIENHVKCGPGSFIPSLHLDLFPLTPLGQVGWSWLDLGLSPPPVHSALINPSWLDTG